MTKTWPMDWTVKGFQVLDKTSGKPSDSASKINWLVQLLTLRTLAALPNLEARMDVVESRVWSTTSKASYLAKVKDHDAELLKHASPHSLAILKKIHQIQDYKFLAMPVTGEPSLAGIFNGCALGSPPQVKLSYQQDGSIGVKVTVTVADPEYPATKLANPLVMIWGDGTITKDTVPAGQSKTLAHTYALGGKYAVYGIAANDSGLRGITALALETTVSSGVKAAPVGIPAIAKVVFEKFAVTEKSLSGNDFVNLFELYMVDGAGKERRFGITAPKASKLNATTAYGDFTGHNNAGLPIKKLVLKPYFSTGFAIGLKEMYVAADNLRFDVYSTEDDKWVSAAVYLKPSDIKVYPKGKTAPIAASNLSMDASGRLKIPLFTKVGYTWTVTSRVEIDLDKTMFSALKLGPTPDPKRPVGKHWIWVEPRPGKLKVIPVCGNTTTESPEECDDGNLVSGDGCSSLCKSEKIPAGVVTFTAKRGASGAILDWTTTSLANCKEFTLLRCQGFGCTKTGHKTVTSIKPIKCKYGAGTVAYSYFDPGASKYLMVSYYLRQHGAAKSSYSDYGPAILAPPQPDMGPDMSPPDIGVPDLPAPDLPPPDQTVPDQTVPDQAAPDQAAVDQSPAKPDTSLVDQAGGNPDQPPVKPDIASSPDQPLPLADRGAPDQELTGSTPEDSGCEVAGAGRGVSGAPWLLLGLLALLVRRREY